MKNQAKPTENWDTKSLDQTFAAMGLNWLQIKAIKQFIAKTLKAKDKWLSKALANNIKTVATLLKQKDMEHAAEVAGIESNYEQQMTAYRGELIAKLEKEKAKFKHDDHSDKDEWYACIKCMEDQSKAIDRAIEIVKGGEK